MSNLVDEVRTYIAYGTSPFRITCIHPRRRWIRTGSVASGLGGSAPTDSGDISVETWLGKKHQPRSKVREKFRSAIDEYVAGGDSRQGYWDSLGDSTCLSEAARHELKVRTAVRKLGAKVKLKELARDAIGCSPLSRPHLNSINARSARSRHLRVASLQQNQIKCHNKRIQRPCPKPSSPGGQRLESLIQEDKMPRL